MKIVGFQSGHDVSYCVLENGIPIIHEELERFTRTKMEYGDGLKFFFERYSKFDNINYFTFGNLALGNITPSSRYQEACWGKTYHDKMIQILAKNGGEYFEFGHHLSHASNAFYTSNFERALIISVDGGGLEEGLVPSALTIDEGIGTKIKRIRIFDVKQLSLGRIYNKATKHIFGLSVGPPRGDQAGTVMAMAALGVPKYRDLFNDIDGNVAELLRLTRLSEQEKFNVASSLQLFTEQAFYAYIKGYIKQTSHENICLSGGVSLNSAMVGKIKKWFPQIKNVFCDPVPYDAGLALGSARYLWHHVLGNPRINGVKNYVKNMNPYLGRVYTRKDIKHACNRYKDHILVTKATDRVVLAKLNDQKIVSVFGGGSESGRRALGNRSIVADPRNSQMKAMINEKVKHRQWFRPFAPSILEEKVDEWFEENYDSPYMSFAVKFKQEVREKVPAVVHFDGTGRLQTVNKNLSPWYHTFIRKWEKLSGVPILLNTSFNDSEPIVESPQDALVCFLKTEIDYVYFFDFGILVEKKK